MNVPLSTLYPTAAWGSHALALTSALAGTTGPVLELGGGENSTPLLHALCAPNARPLWTLEHDPEYLERLALLRCDWHGIEPVDCGPRWHKAMPRTPALADAVAAWLAHPALNKYGRWGVVFIDCWPGEARAPLLELLAPRADVVVVHDTEPVVDAPWSFDYQVERTLCRMKHRLDLMACGGRAPWTTIASDLIDVSAWRVGSHAPGAGGEDSARSIA